MELSKNVDTLIIDHHILRSEEAIEWLEKLEHTAKSKIFCAADFMTRKPILLKPGGKNYMNGFPLPKIGMKIINKGKSMLIIIESEAVRL